MENLKEIEGFSQSIDLSYGTEYVDIGAKVTWSPKPYNKNGDFLYMLGAGASFGPGTKIGGGFTQGNTKLE